MSVLALVVVGAAALGVGAVFWLLVVFFVGGALVLLVCWRVGGCWCRPVIVYREMPPANYVAFVVPLVSWFPNWSLVGKINST